MALEALCFEKRILKGKCEEINDNKKATEEIEMDTMDFFFSKASWETYGIFTHFVDGTRVNSSTLIKMKDALSGRDIR
jgi:hypothetical protein